MKNYLFVLLAIALVISNVNCQFLRNLQFKQSNEHSNRIGYKFGDITNRWRDFRNRSLDGEKQINAQELKNQIELKRQALKNLIDIYQLNMDSIEEMISQNGEFVVMTEENLMQFQESLMYETIGEAQLSISTGYICEIMRIC